jgi:hypothetical protein
VTSECLVRCLGSDDVESHSSGKSLSPRKTHKFRQGLHKIVLFISSTPKRATWLKLSMDFASNRLGKVLLRSIFSDQQTFLAQEESNLAIQGIEYGSSELVKA